MTRGAVPGYMQALRSPPRSAPPPPPAMLPFSLFQTYSELLPPAPAFTEKDLPDLSARVYLVTGGASGIGLELCKVCPLSSVLCPPPSLPLLTPPPRSSTPSPQPSTSPAALSPTPTPPLPLSKAPPPPPPARSASSSSTSPTCAP